MIPVSVILSSIFVLVVPGFCAASPTATVSNGTLRGVALGGFAQEAFLGVRYAQARCPGFGTTDAGQSLGEDCLTLNVLRPEGVKLGSNVPVGVWIYGGGFSHGGSADPRQNATWMVERSVAMKKPIIVVSLNYRVAAGGFLYSKEVAAEGSQNLGLYDQRLALEWINENVVAFGGDPNKVTIWGQSAGAWSVGLHLLAFGLTTTPLFRAAILQSGAPTGFSYKTAEEYQPYYDEIVGKAGCTGSHSTLACLRTLSSSAWNNSIAASSSNSTWYPVVDKEIIPEYPTQLILKHHFVRVPLLIGSNLDEGTSFGKSGIKDDAGLRSALAKSYPHLSNASIDSILENYSDTPSLGSPYGTGDGVLASGLQDKRSFSITGDLMFIGPRRLFATAASANSPVFGYEFKQIPMNGTMLVGATHYDEVAYVYSVPTATRNTLGNRPMDLALAKLMTSSWVSFIHDLDPNENQVKGATRWPLYSEGGENLVFNGRGSYIASDDFRKDGIAFLNQLGSQLQH